MSGYTTAVTVLNNMFAHPTGGMLDPSDVALVLESGAKKIIDVFKVGTSSNDEVIYTFVAPVAMTFKAGLADSAAVAAVAATAESVYLLKTDGGTAWGTITFAAAGTVGTFAAAATQEVAKGSLVTIVAPASADASLAGIAFSLVGYA